MKIGLEYVETLYTVYVESPSDEDGEFIQVGAICSRSNWSWNSIILERDEHVLIERMDFLKRIRLNED